MTNGPAALLGLLLLAAAPALAGEKKALGDARFMSAGDGALAQGYDGCSGGACSAGSATRIDRSVDGALTRGGLFTAKTKPRPAMTAEVPAPKLTADKPGAKSKKGGFGGKGLLYGLGGGAAGAGIGMLLGGPIGALIGGLLGALGGFFLSKRL